MKQIKSSLSILTLAAGLMVFGFARPCCAQIDFFVEYVRHLDLDGNLILDLGDAEVIGRSFSSQNTIVTSSTVRLDFNRDGMLSWEDTAAFVRLIPIFEPNSYASQSLDELKILSILIRDAREPIPVPFGFEQYDQNNDMHVESDELLTAYALLVEKHVTENAAPGFCIMGDIIGPNDGPPDGIVDQNDYDEVCDSIGGSGTSYGGGNLNGLGGVTFADLTEVMRIFWTPGGAPWPGGSHGN